MAREIRMKLPLLRPGLVLLCIVALLVGCGGGGSGGSTTAPVTSADNGQLTIALRDAAGDFLSYAVDVRSLRLERANGDTVETVPLTTRVDFSEVADLTEFFTVASVPAGTYARIVMNFDFTNAQIVVQGDDGAELPVVPVDSNGKPLITLAVVIELPDTEPVRIVRGIPAAVTLDFDLDASNTIDLTTNPAKVTVQPFLSVIPQLEEDRDHRVRGVLATTDVDASTVTLNVRPFHLRHGEFGEVTFATNDQTRFEVNGAALTGAEGLAAVASLAQGTPVVANGAVSSRTLTASMVLAGSSVPWADADVVTGVVTARSGNSLTVRGANFDFSDGTHGFRGGVTVLVGDETRVTSLDSESTARDKDSISIGQRIMAFGRMSGASTLDATAGRVRMEITGLTGSVVQLTPLTVSVVELGGLRPGAFDFSGTGPSAATDANAEGYLVDTATLSLAGVEANDLIKVRGLVHAFGGAPPAFDAITVIDVDTDSIGAWFRASWRESGGSVEPFATVSQDGVDVDLTDARHSLNLLGIPRNALGEGDRIALSGPTSARGIYMVTVRGANEVHLFRDFAGLTPELSDQLSAGNRLVQINAIGRYNATAHELTTPRASFEFITP